MPDEPEWYRTATRSVLLAEEEARTDSRAKVLEQQRAYEEQQRLAQQAQAQQQVQQAYAHPGGAHQQAQAALAYQQAQQAAWLQQQSYSAHYVTAQAQANPTPRPTLRTWILGGIVIVLSLIGAGLMALIIGA